MRSFTILANVCLALCLAAPVRAAVIVDNFVGGPYVNGTSLGNGVADASARAFKAFGLDIGSTSLQFTSLETIFDNPAAASSRVIGGGIYSDNGGNPFALIVSFNLITVPAQAQNVMLTSTASQLLNANTRYWFVLSGATVAGSLPNWQADQSNTLPSANFFASVVGYRQSSDSGVTWTVSTINNQLRIDADPEFGLNVVPEPSTFILSATGLLIANYLRRRR